jgi:hypothetical protein
MVEIYIDAPCQHRWRVIAGVEIRRRVESFLAPSPDLGIVR